MQDSILRIESHRYSVKKLTISENGLQPTKNNLLIEFVKGSRIEEQNKVPKQDGVITQQLLTVCLDHLRNVNKGSLSNRDTSIAITHIEDALLRLNNRERERKQRGVLNTYIK